MVSEEILVQEIGHLTTITQCFANPHLNIRETFLIVPHVMNMTTTCMVRIGILTSRLLIHSTIFHSIGDTALRGFVPRAFMIIGLRLFLTFVIVRFRIMKTTTPITIATVITRITHVNMTIRLVEAIMDIIILSTVMKSTDRQEATESLACGNGPPMGVGMGWDINIPLMHRASMDPLQPGSREYCTGLCVSDFLIRVL